MRRTSWLVVAWFWTLGCGSDSSASGGQGAGADGGATEGGGGSGAGAVGGAASGGGGSDGGGGGGGAGGSEPFIPGPGDVFFEAKNPIPVGPSILFNDWSEEPNVLLALQDGQETEIFASHRIWSMGISNDLKTVAFSAGDPEQEAHFGPIYGDSIQPTFLYDVASETAENLTYGNLNDECHQFGATGEYLYLCRRYDFKPDGTALGYRVGRVRLSDKSFEFLTAEDPEVLTIWPQPTLDESELFYTRIPIPGARSIVKIPMAGGAEETVIASASTGTLSPDGLRMVYTDGAQAGALVVANIDGSDPVVVARGENLSTARWSPDGQAIALLRFDDDAQCSHIETVLADGSQADAHILIHDCTESGRFITELSWVDRK